MDPTTIKFQISSFEHMLSTCEQAGAFRLQQITGKTIGVIVPDYL